ncbi:YaiI/YqxD family protein [Halalkalibacillus sediminis]|uniref:UPF0178 protein CEY16_06825 n=1 Tax=Halalkalibacillus sediminis TaxID=2018042 RepID=A0A2I0QTH6_9BACI|nr:YaiI/YqxD family protein [Halalkalibacillus sediminis]PKR77643.1 YaiI/YqxD family protein [Halalkalibacillus sediminis]
MNILVDADACPVVPIIVEESGRRGFAVKIVRSYDHFSLKDMEDHVETIYVDRGAEAADYKIMQLAEENDVIVTQDYGLASLALSKGCKVMHHKGFQYTTHNIDTMLQQRYLSAMERKSGKRTKGPKAFTNEDREKFKKAFVKILNEFS